MLMARVAGKLSSLHDVKIHRGHGTNEEEALRVWVFERACRLFV